MYFCFPSLDKNAVVVFPTVRFMKVQDQIVHGSLLRKSTSSKPSLIEECFALTAQQP